MMGNEESVICGLLSLIFKHEQEDSDKKCRLLNRLVHEGSDMISQAAAQTLADYSAADLLSSFDQLDDARRAMVQSIMEASRRKRLVEFHETHNRDKYFVVYVPDKGFTGLDRHGEFVKEMGEIEAFDLFKSRNRAESFIYYEWIKNSQLQPVSVTNDGSVIPNGVPTPVPLEGWVVKWIDGDVEWYVSSNEHSSGTTLLRDAKMFVIKHDAEVCIQQSSSPGRRFLQRVILESWGHMVVD